MYQATPWTQATTRMARAYQPPLGRKPQLVKCIKPPLGRKPQRSGKGPLIPLDQATTRHFNVSSHPLDASHNYRVLSTVTSSMYQATPWTQATTDQTRGKTAGEMYQATPWTQATTEMRVNALDLHQNVSSHPLDASHNETDKGSLV